LKNIYLDNSMTTRPSMQAVSSMLRFFNDLWGSSSSPHFFSQQLYPAIKESYQELYDFLGAKPADSIIFTSSGAEAVNQAIFSAYHSLTLSKGKNQFATASIDEAPALMAINRLEELGCVSKLIIPNKQGRITVDAVGDALTPRTAMVSLSWANGLTGVIHPVCEISSLCKERGILLHLDATHILGKLYFELDDVGADFISFNGDHFHAPKGTGALYVKAGVKCYPLILGGMEQAGLRAGTLNVPGLVGLGCAAKEALDSRDLLCTEVARLRDKLEKGILTGFPRAITFFLSQDRLPHCTSIGFPGVSNEALLYLLSKKGVFASIGGGSFQQIGLVLMASGIEEALAHSAINFSLSRETTEGEIDRAVTIIIECANQLSKTSKQLRPYVL
jgi:cysteine desulfurase